MKFSEKIEKIKSKEQFKGKIALVRCGIFIVAIGNDAILLNKLFGLKLTCFKENTCKVGVPVNSVLKYLDLIEEKGYGYVLYDYDKDAKELVCKYDFNGILNTEENTCKECRQCPNYTSYSKIDISNLLEQRKERRPNNE